MTDRPIVPALAGVAAAVFVAGFTAAAVTRPEEMITPAAAAKAAPASAQETARLASVVTPALSQVVALPALHLPKVHQHHKHANKHAAAHVAVKQSAPAPTAVATPVPTAVPTVVPVRPVAPAPAPRKSAPKKSGGYVGSHFDSKG